MDDPEPVLLYRTSEFKAYISLNRPAALNALNGELQRALADAFVDVARNDDVRVVILTGEGGRSFCVGADLKERAGQVKEAVPPRPGGAYPPVSRPGMMLGLDEVGRCPKPVIAAIDGYCLGGGFELALYCDMRLASRASTLGMPEPRRGFLAGPGLIHLSRMIPLGEALRMQLTGTPVTAERAHQIGLVQGLADDRGALLVAAEQLADEILGSSPLAVQYIKRIVKEGRDMSVDQAWRFSEMFQAANAQSEDAREGVLAFTEKRTPEWRMR